MDIIPVRQLTMNMVAAELKLSAESGERAAAIVRRTLELALKVTPEGEAREAVIEEAVGGALTALYLADNNLAHGALLIVQAVLDGSSSSTEPSQAMAAALKAVATLRRFAAPKRLDEIGANMDAQYDGAGKILGVMLRTVAPAS